MILSIIIPAYNEEHRLKNTLEHFGSFFSEVYGDKVEIIVVVNHCSDATEQIARSVQEQYQQIRIVVEASKIGKGGAVRLGMKAAKGDFIGFVDADGSAPAPMLKDLLDHIEDAGCIIGSRWIDGAVVSPKQSFIRRLSSRALNKIIVHKIFGLDIRDSQCGAKIFRREVLDKILPDSVEPGWAFDIELLCRIKRLGYGIREYPIEWHHVPGNATAFIIMGLQMIASVWRVKKVLSC